MSTTAEAVNIGGRGLWVICGHIVYTPKTATQKSATDAEIQPGQENEERSVENGADQRQQSRR